MSFFTPAGEVQAVGGISYTLSAGEILGIVGESGSGKSVEAYTLMGLLPPAGRIVGGEVLFEGENLLAKSKGEMQRFRGAEAGMIFQNPMTSLNPVYTIGRQLTEALTVHNHAAPALARERAAEMLEWVGINNPRRRLEQYPHQLSGGMRQRVMIAMSLMCSPKLLIADEPTTALDVTIQAQILELIQKIQAQTHMGVIFITHNLGVVAQLCHRVAVMYAGHIVELGSVRDIFYAPAHPYTQGLLRAMPRVDARDYQRLIPIAGTPVDMLDPPAGCPFAPRCPHTMKVCLRKYPHSTKIGAQHTADCWLLPFSKARRDLDG